MSTVKDLRENFKNIHKEPEAEPTTPTTPDSPESPTEQSDKKKTKEQEWKEIAEKNGLSREKAEQIIRALFTGPTYQYTERFVLPRNTIMILGTRSTTDTERLEEAIHMQNPRAPEVLAGLVFRYNAAASLIQFGDQKFKHKSNVDFEENIEWLRNLSEPLCQVISKYLSKFDNQVALAMDWVGIENF